MRITHFYNLFMTLIWLVLAPYPHLHCIIIQLAGASYMDIHAQGGGIHFTVDCVQQAMPTQLYDSLKKRLEEMLSCGTTTLEAKSGYGLNLETELKMLQVLERAKKTLPLTISSTYCGAHAVPRLVCIHVVPGSVHTCNSRVVCIHVVSR